MKARRNNRQSMLICQQWEEPSLKIEIKKKKSATKLISLCWLVFKQAGLIKLYSPCFRHRRLSFGANSRVLNPWTYHFPQHTYSTNEPSILSTTPVVILAACLTLSPTLKGFWIVLFILLPCVRVFTME